MLSILPNLMSGLFGQEQNNPSWMLPLVIMLLYQCALEYAYLPLHLSSSSYTSTAAPVLVPLKRWIEDAPRHCIGSSDSGSSAFAFTTTWFFCDFWVANREGLLGCIGYTSLYMTSEWIGHAFVWNVDIVAKHSTQRTVHSSSLWLLGCGLVLLWRFSVSQSIGLGLECSRRSTNAVFICWTLVVNVLVLSGLQAIHGYYYCHYIDCGNEGTDDQKKNTQHQQTLPQMDVLVPVVWAAMNRHGLLCFIAANLLTGILNLTIPNMLKISGPAALDILTMYVSAIGLLALLLDEVLVNRTTARLQQQNASDAKCKKAE